MSRDGAGPSGGEPTYRRGLRQTTAMGVGAVITLLRWPFVRVPLYRRDRGPGTCGVPDLERPLPGDPRTLQRAADGSGSVFHRHYWIEVTDERLDPEALIDRIATDPNTVAPKAMARFQAVGGGRPIGDLRLGDELVVRIAGPWDGPVRVIDRTPTSFRLATLTGHMEAGEIEFRAGRTERGWLRFEIESWASSGTHAFEVLYDRVPIAREMQLHMWAQFCRGVAEVSGGVLMTNVRTVTTRLDPPR